jgi:hypothetical protein
MSKKIILGLALAVVLMSGAFVTAQADCGCLPHISLPTCLSCQNAARDFDKPNATCQGAWQFGPVTPDVMSAPGI